MDFVRKDVDRRVAAILSEPLKDRMEILYLQTKIIRYPIEFQAFKEQYNREILSLRQKIEFIRQSGAHIAVEEVNLIEDQDCLERGPYFYIQAKLRTTYPDYSI